MAKLLVKLEFLKDTTLGHLMTILGHPWFLTLQHALWDGHIQTISQTPKPCFRNGSKTKRCIGRTIIVHNNKHLTSNSWLPHSTYWNQYFYIVDTLWKRDAPSQCFQDADINKLCCIHGSWAWKPNVNMCTCTDDLLLHAGSSSFISQKQFSVVTFEKQKGEWKLPWEHLDSPCWRKCWPLTTVWRNLLTLVLFIWNFTSNFCSQSTTEART